jgi:PhnB protein
MPGNNRLNFRIAVHEQETDMTGIPQGMHSVTPHLMVSNAREALAQYSKAFGAETLLVLEMPGTDIVMHAEFKIGNSVLFISDETPDTPRRAPEGTSSVAFYLYVDDVDALYARAVAGGLTSVSEPADMFWGDRTSVVTDSFGHNWTLATHQKDVSQEEMDAAMKSFMEQGEPAE